MRLYERVLPVVLRHPVWLGAVCLALVGGSYFCYQILGSDLLPGMDEGGFIIDYWSPAGSSLEDTNRALLTVERILRETPEVENTSRRTGLELGLAAVTEANTRRHRRQAEAEARPQLGGGHVRGARQDRRAGARAPGGVRAAPPGHDRRPQQRSRADHHQALLGGPGLAARVGAARGRRPSRNCPAWWT